MNSAVRKIIKDQMESALAKINFVTICNNLKIQSLEIED